MLHLSQIASLLLALSAQVSASPALVQRQDSCASPRQAKPWSDLTSDEQSAYIEAELCLQSTAPTVDVEGAESIWDTLQWLHIRQVSFIHSVGQFLPWHRYFTAVHANLLSDECGYDGPIPYWDEISDSALSDLLTSDIFQNDTFGGNGTGSDQCVTSGPFADLQLRFAQNSDGSNVDTVDPYCLYRDVSTSELQGSNASVVEGCFEEETYEDAWQCYAATPHGAGHLAVGGVMGDVAKSPGDPTFFLHHAWLDSLWWRWQQADLDSRLTDMGGNNVPSQTLLELIGWSAPGPEFTDYDGDDGNVTTLNHVLWMADIYPNVTVGDVMNTNYSAICIEYIYPSDTYGTRKM